MALWNPLSYNTGWSDYGNGYDAGAYRVVGSRVFFRGAIKASGLSGTWPFTIATLGADYFPAAKVLLSTMKSGFSSSGGSVDPCSLTVDTSGNLLYNGPSTFPDSTHALSLEGLSYDLIA